MTPKRFKALRTKVHHLTHSHQPTSGKLVGITINHTYYSTNGKRKDPNRLTTRQLHYFEHLNSIDIDTYYNEGVDL